MIRMAGSINGKPLLGFGLTKTDMARLLQGERIPTKIELTNARGDPLPPMGAVIGRVMGSYAHVIDAA